MRIMLQEDPFAKHYVRVKLKTSVSGCCHTKASFKQSPFTKVVYNKRWLAITNRRCHSLVTVLTLCQNFSVEIV